MFSVASYIPEWDVNTLFCLWRWGIISKRQRNQRPRVLVWALLLTPCTAMSNLQHLTFAFRKPESNKLHNPLRVPTTGLIYTWKQFHLSECFCMLKPCSVCALRGSLWEKQNMYKWKQHLIPPQAGRVAGTCICSNTAMTISARGTAETLLDMEGQKPCVNEIINCKRRLGLPMQGRVSCKGSLNKGGSLGFSLNLLFSPHSTENFRETEEFLRLCVAVKLWVCKVCLNVLGILLGLGELSFNSLLCYRLSVWIQGNGALAFLGLGLPRSRREIKPFTYSTVITQKETPGTLVRRGRRLDWQMSCLCLSLSWMPYASCSFL